MNRIIGNLQHSWHMTPTVVWNSAKTPGKGYRKLEQRTWQNTVSARTARVWPSGGGGVKIPRWFWKTVRRIWSERKKNDHAAILMIRVKTDKRRWRLDARMHEGRVRRAEGSATLDSAQGYTQQREVLLLKRWRDFAARKQFRQLTRWQDISAPLEGFDFFTA